MSRSASTTPSPTQSVIQLRTAEPMREPKISDPVHLLAVQLVKAINSAHIFEEAALAANRNPEILYRSDRWSDRNDVHWDKCYALGDTMLFTKATTLTGAMAQLIQLYHIGATALDDNLDKDFREKCSRKFRYGAHSLLETLAELSGTSPGELGADSFMPDYGDPRVLPTASDLEVA